jgi:hypothetical protein
MHVAMRRDARFDPAANAEQLIGRRAAAPSAQDLERIVAAERYGRVLGACLPLRE